jgi:hypothetical protein
MQGGSKHALALVGGMAHALPERRQAVSHEQPPAVLFSQLLLPCLVVRLCNIQPPPPQALPQQPLPQVLVCHLRLR